MITLIIGKKGSGETKKLIDAAKNLILLWISPIKQD